jgi:benzoate membrane transport protein
MLIGVTGSFSKLLARVPAGIVSAMLAGVLFKFGTGYFAALPGDPERWKVTLMVVAMGAIYFALRARGSRLTIVWTSGGGLVIALLLGLGTGTHAHVKLASLHATAPTFHLGALTGLGLPLLALALSSQYAPGYAVLREAGYHPDMNRILAVTGGLGVPLALLGGPGLNLAAITAGLATGPDAHPDEHQRWKAGVATGLVYITAGIFGASLLSVFSVVPKEFVAAITGLALFGTISGSAASALADPTSRDAAAVTLLCAAGGFTLFHVGAPFWALVAGLAVDAMSRRLRPAPSAH